MADGLPISAVQANDSNWPGATCQPRAPKRSWPKTLLRWTAAY